MFDLDTFRNSRRDEFERVLSSQEGGPRSPRLPVGQNPDGFEVRLRDMPARTVAYIRVLDPYPPEQWLARVSTSLRGKLVG